MPNIAVANEKIALMNSLPTPVHTKRLLIIASILTVPTILFWCAVGVSIFLHNHTYVDVLLAAGMTSRIVLTFILPLISLMIAIVCRINLRQQAIAQNLWHRETPELRANQSLINWSVILLAAMFISLINN